MSHEWLLPRVNESHSCGNFTNPMWPSNFPWTFIITSSCFLDRMAYLYVCLFGYKRSCCIAWYLARGLPYFHTEFLTVFQLHLTGHIPSACSCIIHFIYTHPLHPMLFFKSSSSITSWWDHMGRFSFIQLKSWCSPHYFTQMVKHVLDISFLFAKKGKWLDLTV